MCDEDEKRGIIDKFKCIFTIIEGNSRSKRKISNENDNTNFEYEVNSD